MRISSVKILVTVAALASLAMAGCANNQRPADEAPHPATVTLPPSNAGAHPAAASCAATDVKVTGDFGEKPMVTIPHDCSPPKNLVTKTVVAGEGPMIEAGADVKVNYQLTAWSTGKVVDSSFSRGEPFVVHDIGHARNLIDGWNEGLIGISRGSRVLLIVPPQKGYGTQGRPPQIQPNETLVFVIDVLSVTS